MRHRCSDKRLKRLVRKALLAIEDPDKGIVFDDFVTTGSTLKAMRNVLTEHHKNCVFFTGINNKL